MDEFASLDNELMSAEQANDISSDEVVECTNEYFSNAYGQSYCVGDTIETADGPMTVTSIWEGQAVTDVYGGDLDAAELYDGMGTEMGLSEEQFAEFIDDYNELKREASALDTSHHVLGPTEVESGRLGIRIRQANPDWTDEQVQAEVDRMLDPKNQTADAYADLAKREAALFEQYGMQSVNHATFGQGVFVNGDGDYFRFTGSNGYWQQTSQDDGFLDYAVPIGIAVGAALIGGQVGSLATGGFGVGAGSQTAAGAINNVIGSAISQAAVTGGIDPSSLLQAAIIGGIGGLADAAIDGVLPPSVDEAIWKLADQTGLEYATIVDLAEGVATGAVRGDELEDILLGAAGNIGAVKAKEILKDYFGDTLVVDDLFKPGQSNIPIEALDPLIELGFQAAVEGGASEEDLLKAAFGYFSAGGDIDFLLPDTAEFDAVWEKVMGWLPGLDFEKGGWGIGYDETSKDIVINHDFPNLGIDLDFDLPDGVDLKIGNPCSKDGQEGTLIGGTLAGTFICNIELPSFNIGDPCSDEVGNQGFLNKLGVCEFDLLEIPEIGTPCSTEEGQGIWAKTNLDEMVCEIEIKIETPYNCEEKGAGWTWDNLVGECIPPISVDPVGCGKGETWSEVLGECVPDVIECMRGFKWSDLYNECIPEIQFPDGPDIKVDPIGCGEGETWSEVLGECVPDVLECLPGFEWDGQTCVEINFEIPEWETPEWDTPEWDFDLPDVDLPDLPDVPEVSAQVTTTKPYKTSRTEQFDYTPFNVYKPVAREDLSGINLPSPGKGLFK
jgi:hypothetical protein